MRRVLIVDDDTAVRKPLGDYLKESGFRVADAKSGPVALAIFSLFKPHLVILDILMPEMDGIGVLEEMKTLDPNVCIIMLIALDDPEFTRITTQAGADDYLTKPVDFERLTQALSALGLLPDGAG